MHPQLKRVDFGHACMFACQRHYMNSCSMKGEQSNTLLTEIDKAVSSPTKA